MLLKILAAAAVVLPTTLLAYAATRPDTFRVERTTTIQAPAAAVLPLVTDFRRWQAWSPFEKLDPAMKRTYTGAASGVGAVYAWDGQGHAGAGRMEILAVSPARVTIKLDFTRPMASTSTSAFDLAPAAGGATAVTWSMAGENLFVGKVMSAFFDVDAYLGAEYAKGLTDLKALAEREAAAGLAAAR